MKPVRIVIFAKAPQAGFAKTRLIPALGAEGAAHLARNMLTLTVEKALTANVGPVELCITPPAAQSVWQTIAIADTVQWAEQGEGDLGERMARAAQRVIDADESVLLIGTDCPDLSVAYLQQAATALQQNDAVLFPTFDGGYALLGLKRFHPSLFSDIAWSTDSVALDTLHRLKQLCWTVQIKAKLHDIDEPADLNWLPMTWLDDFPAGSCDTCQ